MFDELTLRGLEATIVWGYRTAAVCKSWEIIRTPGGAWALTATIARADPFQLRQAGLKFTAPRVGGFFCWPVLSLTVGTSSILATLGAPEG
jgi:hypothetical protein